MIFHVTIFIILAKFSHSPELTKLQQLSEDRWSDLLRPMSTWLSGGIWQQHIKGPRLMPYFALFQMPPLAKGGAACNPASVRFAGKLSVTRLTWNNT